MQNILNAANFYPRKLTFSMLKTIYYEMFNPHIKPHDYPVAVISKGTTPQQKVVLGTLSTIVQKTKRLGSPAIIIVGEVVRLREKIQWFKELS